MIPRSYQAAALKAGLAAMAPGSPQLLVLPTGTGKTPLGLWLAEGMVDERSGALLLIVHRDNLLREWSMLFGEAGWRVEIEQGDRRAELAQGELEGRVVVIMMKQTGRSRAGRSARYTRFMPPDLAGVIWDEAHRSVAPSELTMLGHFAAVPVLGLTATPQVPGLADNWTIAYQLTLLDAVHGGWLTQPEWESVVVKGWDWSDMRAPSGEDVSPRQIREHFEGAGGALRVGPPQRVIRRRLHETGAQALVFVPGVPFARAMTNWLNTPMGERDQALQIEEWRDAGHTPEWIADRLPKVAMPVIAALVTGDTPNDERRLTLRRMANGTLQVVVSVLVYVDGLNIENLGMIVLMRPTMLAHLYIQMMGRGLRLHTSIKAAIGLLKTAAERLALIASSPKPKCTILALVPHRAKLDFMTPAKLIAAEREDLEAWRPQGRGEQFDGTLDELLARMEEQRDQWEQAEKARKERLAMIEASARKKRSRHLVGPGDERVTTTTHDMLRVPTVKIAHLAMTWKEYQGEYFGKECATATEFVAARRARAADLYDRASGVDRATFAEHYGEITDRDWARWYQRRAKNYRERSPGQWRSFQKARVALYEHHSQALVEKFRHTPKAAHVKASLLCGLAYCWDQKQIRTEADYWHNKHDPSFEGHAHPWARKNNFGGKVRKGSRR